MFIPLYAKQKIGTDTQIEINIFTVVWEVLCDNYKSCNLIGPYHFWGVSPTNLTLLTRTVSRWGMPAGWARDKKLSFADKAILTKRFSHL